MQAVSAQSVNNDGLIGQSRTVEHVRSPSYDEFVAHYLTARIPVVLDHVVDMSPALHKWTPEFFQKHYSRHKVTIHTKQYGSSEVKHYLLGELIDLVQISSKKQPAPYLINQSIRQLSTELLADLSPLPSYLFPNWIEGPLTSRLQARLDYDGPELHIGGRGASFPSIHYDYCYVNTFLVQIYGGKRIILYSPDQTPSMYPESVYHHGSRIPDADHVDLTEFPLFAQAVPTIVELKPGETLFIPAGWWHTTRISSPCITVSFEHANKSNWKDLTRECCYLMPQFAALKFRLYLTILRLLRSVLR